MSEIKVSKFGSVECDDFTLVDFAYDRDMSDCNKLKHPARKNRVLETVWETVLEQVTHKIRSKTVFKG